ncbi:MAG: PEGA domain-containing protein [Deltaproteobacteria bacterium]|nr:MAG: PEGA domain-containing protein [Deltaproteobacteria bacterium]TMQ28028.1 MAG: PEGA domain-containing protein [Deltaproteobacteria bacterium]
MLAGRIVAVSPDKGLAKQLALALRVAGGAVELHDALDALGPDQLGAALCVVHCDGELAALRALLPRLTGDCQVIAVLPRVRLGDVVDLMQASPRVTAVMVAEDFEARTLSAMAMRALTGDVFGLEKMVMWGVQVHAQLVGDFHEKAVCMSQIAEFAELIGVPRRAREAIEQCVDEMVMNALYDAPVDEHGAPIFAGVPTRTRISLRTEHVVVVQYAYDGRQFAVSVRDAFGSLERDAVLRVLHKCLHAEQPVDRRAGGAGIGLFMMASLATGIQFHVAAGIATEVVCTFDLEFPEARLDHIGFFLEHIDVTERLAGSGSRGAPGERRFARLQRPDRPASRARVLVAGLVAAIAAALVLIGVAAWPRLFDTARPARVVFTTIPRGAAIEVDGRGLGSAASGTLAVDGLEIGKSYTVVARLDGYQPQQVVVQPRDGVNELTLELAPRAPVVEVDSEPTGAALEIAGKQVGTTPIALTSLAPGAEVSIVLRRAGYRDAIAYVEVPAPGERRQIVQHLEVSDDMVRVRFVSTPPGAQVIQIDRREPSAGGGDPDGSAGGAGGLPRGIDHTAPADRTYTPAELLVEAGREQRFALTMPHHVPLVIPPFTPARGDRVIEKGGTLVEGAMLRIEAAADGKATVSGAPHCTAIAVPADCTLAPGRYTVEYVGAGATRATRAVTVADQDLTVTF